MPRPEDSPLILWLDLETTGSRDTDKIIEIGAVLTDRDLIVIDEFAAIIRPPGWPHYQVDPVVYDMHTANGLWDEVESGMTAFAADVLVTKWLKEYAKQYETGSAHIPYAGSGVGHFDRAFIKRDLPTLSKRISYWPYDVSPMRRAYRLWDIEVPGMTDGSKEDSDHRALPDAYAALQQFEQARDATVKAFALLASYDNGDHAPMWEPAVEGTLGDWDAPESTFSVNEEDAGLTAADMPDIDPAEAAEVMDEIANRSTGDEDAD